MPGGGNPWHLGRARTARGRSLQQQVQCIRHGRLAPASIRIRVALQRPNCRCDVGLGGSGDTLSLPMSERGEATNCGTIGKPLAAFQKQNALEKGFWIGGVPHQPQTVTGTGAALTRFIAYKVVSISPAVTS
ncbi:MAG: hypothetical protein PVSMB7_10780 [Chloroflexota bacterium]